LMLALRAVADHSHSLAGNRSALLRNSRHVARQDRRRFLPSRADQYRLPRFVSLFSPNLPEITLTSSRVAGLPFPNLDSQARHVVRIGRDGENLGNALPTSADWNDPTTGNCTDLDEGEGRSPSRSAFPS
jgi:hypothetical protein